MVWWFGCQKLVVVLKNQPPHSIPKQNGKWLHCHPNPISQPEHSLHPAIIFVWMMQKANKTPLGVRDWYWENGVVVWFWLPAILNNSQNPSHIPVQNGFIITKRTIKTASLSCKHLYVNNEKGKQNSIGDEWLVLGNGVVGLGWVGCPLYL